MEKIHFSIQINAPREKVWDTMLTKGTYEQWAAPFHEGSTFEGTWEEGTEMHFVGPSEDGGVAGMLAIVTANRPYEFVSVKHLVEITNGEKKPFPVMEGEEGYESYAFKDVEGGTEVSVELSVPTGWKDMFVEMWPKALAVLKEVAEKE